MSIKDIVQKERQISIDPVSMKEIIIDYPPKPQTAKKNNKFVSTSLPNSACSSPRSRPTTKDKNYDQVVWVSENHLQKSKSCNEGRPSVEYDEFDLTTIKTSCISASADSTPRPKPRPGPGPRPVPRDQTTRIIKRKEEDFKCGALCLFLPGFGNKGKPVRSRRDQEREETRHVISQRVSLEKFECGSWRSSGVFNDFSSNLYFDLPLELIKTSGGNDANLPVNSAFVFDKDVKGVLKTKSGGGERNKSNDYRHVRFSTSSPATSPSPCFTPRMRKARDEFNSFLEAQNA